ncbi:MAG TPA: peptidoglycan bridge formation glycyltransferase FemA/FemB family protein, partial [Verrucomicrobiae bacterium]|nr:peptidoglycan bridge formation glycyltransferase FemA/FemB family protein [Verrucomicrobiae bacterium]
MISDLSQEAWDKKVIDLGGSILQSWIWGQFQESMGHKIHRFSSDSYTNLLIEMGLPFGKRYLYSSKGPLGDVQTALTDIQKFSTNPNVVFSRIEPAHTVDLPKAAKDTQPANNWLLNLEPSEDQLLTNMKPKHRYNINLAAKKGVTFREGNKEDILTVWKILMETSTRAGFNLHPQNYYWQMFEVLSPKYLKLLV